MGKGIVYYCRCGCFGLSPTAAILISPLFCPALFFELFTLIVGIYWLYVSFTSEDMEDCMPLPTWIFAAGLIKLVNFTIIQICGKWIKGYSKKTETQKIEDDDYEEQPEPEDVEQLRILPSWVTWIFTIFQVIFGLFFLAWFVVGNIYIWTSDEDDCDAQAFRLVRTYIIILWAVFGIVFLLVLPGCCLYWGVFSNKGLKGMKVFIRKHFLD